MREERVWDAAFGTRRWPGIVDIPAVHIAQAAISAAARSVVGRSRPACLFHRSHYRATDSRDTKGTRSTPSARVRLAGAGARWGVPRAHWPGSAEQARRSGTEWGVFEQDRETEE